MKAKWILVSTFLMLLMFFESNGQPTHELWTRLQVTKGITPHVSVGMDFQHRRIGDSTGGETPCCGEQKLNSLRLWTFYKAGEHLTIILSPVAYFKNYDGAGVAGTHNTVDELRSMAGGSHTWKVKNATLINRLMYEITYSNVHGDAGTIRHRYRLQNSFVVPLFEPASDFAAGYHFYNEFFFKTQEGTSGFDHNRVFNGIKFRAKQNELLMGYMLSLNNHGKSSNHWVLNIGIHIK